MKTHFLVTVDSIYHGHGNMEVESFLTYQEASAYFEKRLSTRFIDFPWLDVEDKFETCIEMSYQYERYEMYSEDEGSCIIIELEEFEDE